MPGPTEITVAQLARLLGTPNAPIVVDVRIDEDFEQDPCLIPSAFRHPHRDMPSLLDQRVISDQHVVVYCQRGKKLSQGAAAILRNHGVTAEVLQGGQFAWRDAGQLQIPIPVLPVSDHSLDHTALHNRLWVTRHRPKIDRLACPWLIRRFVDPGAQFLFVSPAEVFGVCDRFDAIPFDTEGADFSHRGELCTFDAMLSAFDLRSEALDTLAGIVRGADTNRHELAPQVAGFLAVSLGLSRMYRDDLQLLEAAMQLYDALYRWARDAIDESHHCPQSASQT